MPVRHPSHLHRNRCGVFGFRIVVPRDLRHVVPGSDHRLSLHTSSLNHAKTLGYRLALAAQMLFERLRTMTKADAADKGAEFMAEMAAERDKLLERFKRASEARATVQSKITEVGERFQALLALSPEARPELAAPVTMPSDLLKIMGLAEVPSTFDVMTDAVTAEVQRLAAEEASLRVELAEIAGLSDAWSERMTAFQALNAQADQHRDHVETLQEFMAGVAAKANNKATPHESAPPTAWFRAFQGLNLEGGKQSVSEFFGAYCEAHRSEWKNWDRRVKHDLGPIRDELIAVAGGDIPIEQLTAQHSTKFVQRIRSTVTAKGGKAATVANKVDRLKSVFNWGRQQTLLHDLTGPLAVDAEYDSYEAFTPDELKVMFESSDYSANAFGRPSQFWLPLLGLYTGARVEELASIRVEHLQERDGIRCVLLSPDGKKSGKNDLSRRQVPLHPALVACGLDNYLETLVRERHVQLFPCLPLAARDGRGKAAGRDFSQFRQAFDIGNKVGEGRGTKVFHSFRSTLISALQAQGIPEEVRASISGHALPGVHQRIYSQAELPMQIRLDALQAVQFMFSHPRWQDSEAQQYARKHGRMKPRRRSAK